MAKKKRTRDTAADFARRSNATSRMRSPEKMFAASPREPIEDSVGMRAAPVLPRPIPRPVRGGMKSSLVPTPRPYTMEERGAVERGNRAAEREAQNFADGGMVRGCGPAQMSGKGFRGDF